MTITAILPFFLGVSSFSGPFIGAPQYLQNFCPSDISLPQLLHFMFPVPSLSELAQKTHTLGRFQSSITKEYY